MVSAWFILDIVVRHLSLTTSADYDYHLVGLCCSKSHWHSSVHTAGLTDYEVRDLNDEINKLLREKHHWENQIIFLGGANYKRAGKMTDAQGREVPGMRGYKWV
jgi:hypothetical protein